MATDHNHGHSQNPEVDFEHSDLGHRGIWMFFAFLAVSGIVIALVGGALYKGFDYANSKMEPVSGPMVEHAQDSATPKQSGMQNTTSVNMDQFSAGGKQPLLQANDAVDMEQFRAEENLTENAAPWKEQNGTVHLPIDRAMELVIQHNMASRAQGSDPSKKDPMMVPDDHGFAGFAAAQKSTDAAAVEEAPANDVAKEQKPEQPAKAAPAVKK